MLLPSTTILHVQVSVAASPGVQSLHLIHDSMLRDGVSKMELSIGAWNDGWDGLGAPP